MDKACVESTLSSNSLTLLRTIMKKQGVTALLIRSTDRYFNEYVPKSLSVRAQITGFDGSVGDALITLSDAYLFVDGRYTLQAKTQSKNFQITVSESVQSIESAWLDKLPSLLSAKDVLAYDPTTLDLRLFERLSKTVLGLKAILIPEGPAIFAQFFSSPLKLTYENTPEIREIDKALCGFDRKEKLEQIKALLKGLGVEGFLVVKLDDIAWISNLRSHYFPYQSSFPGIACVFFDSLLIGSDFLAEHFSNDTPGMQVVRESELFQTIKEKTKSKPFLLGIDGAETSKAHEIALLKLDIAIKQVDNPLSALKAIKNEKELLHLREAFKKADIVVHHTENFVVESFEKKHALKESDVDLYVKNEFKKSTALDLSFRPICASGSNGAIIHYGTPDSEKDIEEGSLFLLDTGAYYEGGYATDLTRTFLAAKKSFKAKPWQQEMFTLVLKASIKGLSARLRRGSLGMQLDALVRAPLWQVGLDFAHGTGHGVGINVHEFPPRIAPSSTSVLLEGQVFSIEPGLYFENLGGVRIENLVTIVADKENPNFIRVLPLTFCPFDERLIDLKMLDTFERSFLDYYKKEWEDALPWPRLPPLSTTKF